MEDLNARNLRIRCQNYRQHSRCGWTFISKKVYMAAARSKSTIPRTRFPAQSQANLSVFWKYRRKDVKRVKETHKDIPGKHTEMSKLVDKSSTILSLSNNQSHKDTSYTKFQTSYPVARRNLNTDPKIPSHNRTDKPPHNTGKTAYDSSPSGARQR